MSRQCIHISRHSPFLNQCDSLKSLKEFTLIVTGESLTSLMYTARPLLADSLLDLVKKLKKVECACSTFKYTYYQVYVGLLYITCTNNHVVNLLLLMYYSLHSAQFLQERDETFVHKTRYTLFVCVKINHIFCCILLGER